MRATFAWSPSDTIALLPSFRLVFGDFDERICRVFVCPRTILPVPVFLKRLAAPEWVFNLGIVLPWMDPALTTGSQTLTGQGLPCLVEA